MSTKALIGLLLAGTAGILIFLFVHLSGDSNKISIGSKSATACSGGAYECLPNLNYVDTTGKAYTPESLKGKVVIINFWATWCVPCKKEIPDLSKLYLKYRDKGLVILGILTNDQATDADLLNFSSDYEMEYPTVRANSDIMVTYEYPDALPMTFIFDRQGRLVGNAKVGSLRMSDLDSTLSQLVDRG
jgi:thiol-disulfide isomerase/thioredoxin